jgi:S-formylglutathione hydrolase FrmB
MRLALLLLALAACGTSNPRATGAGAATGTIARARFHSDALGVDKPVVVWLPAGYAASSKRYPTIYLLHGLGGMQEDFLRHGKLAEVADELALQAIVVMPDGDDGWYVDWAEALDYDACLRGEGVLSKEPEDYCVRSPRYETYVAKDLIAWVDATYRTIAAREGRAIGGFSMGGFGALGLAMRHSDLFGAVASFAGVDAMTYTGAHPYVRGQSTLAQTWDDIVHSHDADLIAWYEHVFGHDLARWRAADPIVLAETLEDGRLAVWLSAADADRHKLQDGAQYLDERLTARGVRHTFVFAPGAHDYKFVHAHLAEALRFLVAALR